MEEHILQGPIHMKAQRREIEGDRKQMGGGGGLGGEERVVEGEVITEGHRASLEVTAVI